MGFLVNLLKGPLTFLLVASLLLLGCSEQESTTVESFVGKWQQTKLVTPIYLYANGEWEIKTDDGSILQYGVWQYKDKNLFWSFKQANSNILHEVTPVLSVTSQEFQIQESDMTVTTYKRLD